MSSMTFLINDSTTGGSTPVVQVVITQNADGTVTFDVTQLAGYVGDLRGLFFDLADETVVGTLKAVGTALTELQQGNDSVIDLGGGANMQGLSTSDGGGYDVGVEIGTSGLKTNDDVRTFTFTLDSTLRDLTLSDFANVSFGARVTSVGLDANLDGTFETARTGSSKTGEVTFSVVTPTPDAADVLEDLAASGNLLANDGGGAGDALSITGWSGGALGIAQSFADLPGVTVRVNADGSYSVDANGADALAQGQVATKTFSYNLLQTNVDGTSMHTVAFTVTVTGTNDTPTVTAVTNGAVTEDAGTPDLSTTVAVEFDDVDLSDTLSYSFVKSSGTLGGTLSLLSSDDSGAQASGSVSYTYSVANSATQSLAAGQQATETFTITASDGHGGSVSQLVTVVVTGANDAPDVRVEVGDSASTILEEGNGPGPIASGFLTVTDVDLTDSVTAAVDSVELVGTAGGLTAADVQGMLQLTPWGFLAADGNLAADPGGLNNLRWNFEPGLTSFDFLAAGESLTLNYVIRCADGTGAADTQTVAITIAGQNDGPVFVGAQTGISTPEDGPEPTLTGDGSITFSDLDLSDSHAVTTSAVAGNTFPGTFSAALVQAANQPGNGQVDWHFEVARDAVQYLAAGESATNHYLVTIDDGRGGQLVQPIDVTITGRNDGPTVSVAVATAAVTEDALPTVATGTITFDDLDLTDTHTTSVDAATDNALGGVFTATVTQAATGAGNGTVTWNYEIDNDALQQLAEGQTVVERFTVTIDDGEGGTVSQLVSITASGTNDRPLLTFDDTEGTLFEADGAVTLSEGGNLAFSDIDLGDVVTVSQVGSTAPVWSGGTLSAEMATALLEGFTVDQDSWQYSSSQNLDFLGAGQTITMTFDVAATDDSGAVNAQSAVQTITLVINGSNDAPTLAAEIGSSPLVDTAADDGFGPLSGQLDGADLDQGDALGYALGTGEDGQGDYGSLQVNSDGSYTYTPNDAAIEALGAGSVTDVFAVRVSDGQGGFTENTLTVQITGANDAPALTASLSATTYLDSAVDDTFVAVDGTLSATDRDAVDTRTFSIEDSSGASNLAGFDVQKASVYGTLHLNASTGAYRFVPNDAAIEALTGDAAVSFDLRVTDAAGINSSTSFTVTLDGSNDTPVISSNGGTANAAVAVAENSTAVTTVLAGDVDSPSLTYSIFGGLDAARFHIDPNTGALTFVSAPNFEAPTDAGPNNVYDVIVQASDGSTVDQQAIAVTVTDVVENQAPTDIVLTGSNTPGNSLAGSGATVATLSTVDPDIGDTSFSYTLLSQTANGGATTDFAIVGNALQVASGQALDQLTTYELSIRTADAQGATYMEQFQVVTGRNGGNSTDTVSGGSDGPTPYNGEDVLYGGNSNTNQVDVLLGLGGNDILYGQNGRDLLNGGDGNDQLYGGSESDTFIFDTALNAVTNVDTIRDFQADGTDKIQLDDDIFQALGPVVTNTTLANAAFASSAGGNATDASVRILYDTATGNLFYDADGNGVGAKVLFATLTLSGVSGTVDAGDFTIVP